MQIGVPPNAATESTRNKQLYLRDRTEFTQKNEINNTFLSHTNTHQSMHACIHPSIHFNFFEGTNPDLDLQNFLLYR